MLVRRHGIDIQWSRTNFKVLEEERGNGKESADMVLLLEFFHMMVGQAMGNVNPAKASISEFIVVVQLRWSKFYTTICLPYLGGMGGGPLLD